MGNPTLGNEEKQNVKWFLSLFYIILVSYDVFYYYIYPKYVLDGKHLGFPSVFSYWFYLIIISLFPLALYLNKRKKSYLVKYIYFISYIVLTILNDIYIYLKYSQYNASGNAVEVFFILFSPIFVNSRFFLLVSIGILTKYMLMGAILHSAYVFTPIILVSVLSIIAYILLNRFQGYVSAVKISYDKRLEGIVKGVIATLELKDQYTRGHSERVAGYALLLAKKTGKFSREELKSFNYACLLHDIGKIHIPDQILMKPSKLTNEEFEIIKTHPIVGAEAVREVEGLQESIDIIRSHHERWDGKGYPDQLKGEAIPLLARIVAIADAFDAMTSTRSYRAALSLDEAYKRIIEGKGTQFDPKLVEIFKDVYPEWLEFYSTFSERSSRN